MVFSVYIKHQFPALTGLSYEKEPRKLEKCRPV